MRLGEGGRSSEWLPWPGQGESNEERIPARKKIKMHKDNDEKRNKKISRRGGGLDKEETLNGILIQGKGRGAAPFRDFFFLAA